MNDLTVLVDQVAERHYLERCKQLTDPQPLWDDVDPMVRHRLREWVLPTVNATVELMVEAMKAAVDEERAKVVAYLRKQLPDVISFQYKNITENYFVGDVIGAIEAGAHDGAS